jgi:Putative  PD-(D/E)XK family member, (DUF4420)
MIEHKSPSSLNRAWAVLEIPRWREFESFPLDVVFAERSCRAALDREGVRHLLVPIVDETLSQDSRASVLCSATRVLSFAGEISTYVDIWCTESALHDEFDGVIEDILDDIASTDRPGAAALANLARWRRLFRNRLVQGLGPRARRGLFAELSVLLAMVNADPHISVDIWTGPMGDPHDFETPKRSIEVKATAPGVDSIVINGLQQLDTHGGRPLDLVVLTVVTDPNGTTITDLVSEINTRMGTQAGFEKRLARLGWQSGDENLDTESFAIVKIQRVPIGDTTPRLVPAALSAGALPEGISEVTYRLAKATLAVHATSGTLDQIAGEAIR